VASDIDAEHVLRLKNRFQYRPRVEVQFCDLTEPSHFRQLKEGVESVVCLNVLEHVEDDLGGLRNIYSSLAPGGRAIVLVPQDQRAFGTLDELVGHFRRYSKAELRDKMERAGFQVETILEFNRAAFPGWFVNGRILKRKKFSRFQIQVFDRLVWLWRRCERVFPWPSASIIGIATKPGLQEEAVVAETSRSSRGVGAFGSNPAAAPAHFTGKPALSE
jgi:SAM-dependent methyltransferase